MRHLLVRAPNWLGDVVMSASAIKALHDELKPERLTVLCRKPLENLLDRYPFVDDTVSFGRVTEPIEHAKLADNKADLLVLLTNSFRTAWDGFKTGAKKRVGYAGNFRSFLLTNAVPRNSDMHMEDFYFRLVKEVAPNAVLTPTGFPLTDDERTFANGIVGLEGAIAIPLGAKYGPAKCWPEERLIEFMKLVFDLTERNIVFFGTASEEEASKRLAAVNPLRVVSLVGHTSIGQMAAAMNRCSVVIANDSGPLHIASALGKKTVALFGSTSAEHTAPRADCVTVIKGEAHCAPCFKRECPTDFACMNSISAESVFKEITGRNSPL